MPALRKEAVAAQAATEAAAEAAAEAAVGTHRRLFRRMGRRAVVGIRLRLSQSTASPAEVAMGVAGMCPLGGLHRASHAATLCRRECVSSRETGCIRIEQNMSLMEHWVLVVLLRPIAA